jgi:transposase
MIFVGIDWAETHHDACIVDVDGRVLAKGRVPEGVHGVAKLHEMVAAHAEDPSEVVVGIEPDRGLLVGALVWTGYAVHAMNPLSVDRTGTATERRGRSPIRVTPRSSPIWSGPTDICIARWPATASSPER